MSEMNAVESIERFSEGMKKAASRARELGAAQKDRNWNKLAFQLEKIMDQGMNIFKQKALSESEVMAMTEHRISEMNKDING